MTAICGWVSARPREARERCCSSALRELAAYGSAQPRVSSLDSATFGIDLSVQLPEDRFDAQPMARDCALIAADLRLDDREELAAAIGPAAADTEQMADSQLFALAWDKWDAASFGRLIGDFAIAVFCRRDRTLWLARSVGGNRPLFYARHPEAIAFASMAGALLIDPSLRRGFDRGRLAEGLVGLAPEDERSFFTGVQRVQPGHVVAVRRESHRSEPIWSPAQGILRLNDDREYVEAYRAVLDEAVRQRLRLAGGCIAAYLSAGFDSSAVAATAARLAAPGDEPISLTAAPRAGYDGPSVAGRVCDESSLAAGTAAMHGMDHVVIRSRNPTLSHLAAQARTYQDPFRNVVNSDWDVVLRQAAQQRGATVLLTGDMGNQTLNAGGPEILADLIARGAWATWFREAWAALGVLSVRTIAARSFDRWVPASWLRARRRRMMAGRSMAEESFVRRDWLGMLGPIEAKSSPRFATDRERRWFLTRTFDPGNVRKGAFAETPIDVRDPLLDRRVIEFSLSLPPDRLFASGVASPLARQALADRLPQAILRERIRGYQAADWHERLTRQDMLSMIEEIASCSAAHELIDFARLRSAVDAWPQPNVDELPVISRYVSYIPATLATGYFLRAFDREAG